MLLVLVIVSSVKTGTITAVANIIVAQILKFFQRFNYLYQLKLNKTKNKL